MENEIIKATKQLKELIKTQWKIWENKTFFEEKEVSKSEKILSLFKGLENLIWWSLKDRFSNFLETLGFTNSQAIILTENFIALSNQIKWLKVDFWELRDIIEWKIEKIDSLNISLETLDKNYQNAWNSARELNRVLELQRELIWVVEAQSKGKKWWNSITDDFLLMLEVWANLDGFLNLLSRISKALWISKGSLRWFFTVFRGFRNIKIVWWITGIIQSFKNLEKNSRKIINPLWKIKNFFWKIWGKVRSFWKALKFISRIFLGVGRVVVLFWTRLNLIWAAITLAYFIFKKYWDKIKDFASNTIWKIPEIIKEKWDTFVKNITDKFSGLISFFEEKKEAFMWFFDFWDKDEEGKWFFSSIKKWIESVKDSAKLWGEKLQDFFWLEDVSLDSIKDKFSGVLDDFTNVETPNISENTYDEDENAYDEMEDRIDWLMEKKEEYKEKIEELQEAEKQYYSDLRDDISSISTEIDKNKDSLIAFKKELEKEENSAISDIKNTTQNKLSKRKIELEKKIEQNLEKQKWFEKNWISWDYSVEDLKNYKISSWDILNWKKVDDFIEYSKVKEEISKALEEIELINSRIDENKFQDFKEYENSSETEQILSDEENQINETKNDFKEKGEEWEEEFQKEAERLERLLNINKFFESNKIKNKQDLDNIIEQEEFEKLSQEEQKLILKLWKEQLLLEWRKNDIVNMEKDILNEVWVLQNKAIDAQIDWLSRVYNKYNQIIRQIKTALNTQKSLNQAKNAGNPESMETQNVWFNAESVSSKVQNYNAQNHQNNNSKISTIKNSKSFNVGHITVENGKWFEDKIKELEWKI